MPGRWVDESRNGVRKRIDTGWLVRRLEEACEKSSIRRAGIQKTDQPSILFCKSRSMKTARLDPASRFDTGTQPTALFLSYLDLSANLLSTFRLPSVNVPETCPIQRRMRRRSHSNGSEIPINPIPSVVISVPSPLAATHRRRTAIVTHLPRWEARSKRTYAKIIGTRELKGKIRGNKRES